MTYEHNRMFIKSSPLSLPDTLTASLNIYEAINYVFLYYSLSIMEQLFFAHLQDDPNGCDYLVYMYGSSTVFL
jgi:hypothetical protein